MGLQAGNGDSPNGPYGRTDAAARFSQREEQRKTGAYAVDTGAENQQYIEEALNVDCMGRTKGMSMSTKSFVNVPTKTSALGGRGGWGEVFWAQL